MFDLKPLRIFVGAALLSTLAVACAPPEATNGRHASTRAKVSTALSSASSKSKLGVTRWHSTVLSGRGGAKGGTIDGQDASGKVRFLAAIREDGKTGTLHIESILPKRGEWIFDGKEGKVTKSSLSPKSLAFTTAFTADWRAAHPEKKTRTALRKGGSGKKTGDVTHLGDHIRPGEDDPIVSGASYWLLYWGNKKGYLSDRTWDAYSDPEGFDRKNYDEKGKRLPPKTDAKEVTPEETPEAKPEEVPAEQNAPDAEEVKPEEPVFDAEEAPAAEETDIPAKEASDADFPEDETDFPGEESDFPADEEADLDAIGDEDDVGSE